MLKCPCGEIPIVYWSKFAGWCVKCPKNQGVFGNCGKEQYMVGGMSDKKKAMEMWNKLLKGQV